MVEVQRIAGARVVDIVARVLLQPVIAAIVEAAETERRAEFAALAGVVVDHIHQDLDAGAVEASDHGLELGNRGFVQVTRLRREEADGLVAPVVPQLPCRQELVVDESLRGQQLDRRDAEPGQIFEHRLRRQAKESAGRRGTRMAHRHAFHMRLVNHHFGDRNVRREVVTPGEGRIGDDAFRHEGRAVARIEREIVAFGARLVSHQFRPDNGRAGQPLRVRVDQKLVGIEAVALVGAIGALGAVAIELPRPQPRHVAVPDVAIALRQIEPAYLVLSVFGKQAQRHAARMFREYGEVDAVAVEGRADGSRPAGADGMFLGHGCGQRLS